MKQVEVEVLVWLYSTHLASTLCVGPEFEKPLLLVKTEFYLKNENLGEVICPRSVAHDCHRGQNSNLKPGGKGFKLGWEENLHFFKIL